MKNRSKTRKSNGCNDGFGRKEVAAETMLASKGFQRGGGEPDAGRCRCGRECGGVK